MREFHLSIFTAAQMWLLGRLLPLIVGELVPHDDECWKTFLLLLDIMDIMDKRFAPELLPSDAPYLQTLICDHHNEFVRLYSVEKLLPKFHFLIRTPRLILE